MAADSGAQDSAGRVSGGSMSKPLTESADGRYQYGTKEEVSRRLEDGYPPTESHFSQIRPRTERGPNGRSLDETLRGAGSGQTVRNGKMGKDVRHHT